MSHDLDTPLPDTMFWRAYQGRFEGVLTWQKFDAFWQVLAGTEGAWYVFDLEADAPEKPATPAELAEALEAARVAMETVRNRSYCGTVFADDLKAPSFVKIFDPWQMGGVCGGSGERTFPRWVFSRIVPDPLPKAEEIPEKKGFFARMVG